MAIRLLAFDLDGTVTQHKSPIEQTNLALFTALSRRYRLLMVGAGQCLRIWHQLNRFPLDVIGNYGMQCAVWDEAEQNLRFVYDEHAPVDRVSVSKRVEILRQKHGFTQYAGDSVEFHPSGCVTIPLLGTSATLTEKLAFDPDRSRRRAILSDVRRTFPDYTVFVGGTSSFDMAPAPYNKYYALDRYCRENGYAHGEVLYAGDDYGAGGNDESVFASDFSCVRVDDYRKLGDALAFLGE